MWFYDVPIVCAVADLRCCNTWHTGSRTLYAFHICTTTVYRCRVLGTFPGETYPILCLGLRPHGTTSPYISSVWWFKHKAWHTFTNCSDIYQDNCFSYENSTTVHPQIQVSNKGFFLPSLCSVSKFSNCIALYYGPYVEFLMKEAKTMSYSGCVQILGTINITQMR